MIGWEDFALRSLIALIVDDVHRNSSLEAIETACSRIDLAEFVDSADTRVVSIALQQKCVGEGSRGAHPSQRPRYFHRLRGTRRAAGGS